VTCSVVNDYRTWLSMGEEAAEPVGRRRYMQRGEKKNAITHFKRGWEWMRAKPLAGHHSQRYKGLR